MRNILAIARKELTVHFTTVRGWAVLATMTLLGSWFFLGLLVRFREVHQLAQAFGWQKLGEGASAFKNLTDGIVVQHWGVLIFVTVIAAPVFTLGLFAQEYDRKTFELLMTTPVRASEIVIGKYLGALGMVLATLGVTLVYPAILAVFGASESGSALEWSTVLTGYGALLLIGAASVAINMFISSLTDSALVAVSVGIVMMFMWLVLGLLTNSLDEPLRSAALFLTIDGQTQNLLKGVFDPRPLVFFGSVVAFFLLLTHRAIEAKRWTE